MLLKFIRVFKFMKVVRLLRALKLKKIILKIEEKLDIGATIMGLFGFFKLVTLIMCLAHWCACLFIIIAQNETDWKKTWMH